MRNVLPITIELQRHQYEALAIAARTRGLTPSGLLQLLGETFVATQQLPGRPVNRPGRPGGDPVERISEVLARRVQRDGEMTVGAAWRSLSYRDRSRGRDVFTSALDHGQRHDLFRLASHPERLVPAIASPAAQT